MAQQYGKCSVCGKFGPVRVVDSRGKSVVCAGGCKPKPLSKEVKK